MTSDARRIADWLSESRQAVAFTGAGISTESGIPDFRSPGGIWSRVQPVLFDDFMRSADARLDYWRQKVASHDDFADAQPNAGHLTLAHWESAGWLRGVITQNIDGLHQLAGSRRVLELHGTARRASCLDCGASYDADALVKQFRQTETVPECRSCSDGRVKHATISFGQPLPVDVLEESSRWCEEADLMLVCGSSLVVHPAAGLPQAAKLNGAKLIIINREPTPLDGIADLVIHDGIGQTLTAVAELLPAADGS